MKENVESRAWEDCGRIGLKTKSVVKDFEEGCRSWGRRRHGREAGEECESWWDK